MNTQAIYDTVVPCFYEQVGASLREGGLPFSYLLEATQHFAKAHQDAIKRGYRGTVEYPQHIGSGSHLWHTTAGRRSSRSTTRMAGFRQPT